MGVDDKGRTAGRPGINKDDFKRLFLDDPKLLKKIDAFKPKDKPVKGKNPENPDCRDYPDKCTRCKNFVSAYGDRKRCKKTGRIF